LVPADDVKLDPAVIAALYVQHADELRYFLWGVLKNADLATEVMQIAFAKAVEVGHTVQVGSLKSWLFRVAYNEALAIRRREAVADRITRELAEQSGKDSETRSRAETDHAPPDVHVSRFETVAAVRKALNELPADQRQVVWMRIYEQKKFAQIANELSLPLGTVLSRMHLALKKLRRLLAEQHDQDR
jgi:RNA polymerase sigma-70 factor (ECF subfamily)